MWRILVLAAVSCAFLAGCGGDSKSESAASAENAPANQAELDKLRALPYAGYGDVEPGEEEDGVVICDPARSQPGGATLMIFYELCQADLLDAQGNLLHRWSMPGDHYWENGELLENGDFLVVGGKRTDTGPLQIRDEARYLLRFSWNGDVVWQKELRAHHDVEVTPRGDILTLTFARRPIPSINETTNTRDDHLSVLTQDGKVIKHTSLLGILGKKPDEFQIRMIPPDDLGVEPWVDVLHCNSVEWMSRQALFGTHPIFQPQNILICSRHQDRIFVVDYDQQELIWWWGWGELSGPHDATVLANGHILVFDNGVKNKASRVVEMDPATGKIVWQYQAADPKSFYTLSKGSAQRLANGNTLIACSDSGKVFEVTPAGETVWEYRCTFYNQHGRRAAIVRAYRFAPGYIEGLIEKFGQPAATPGD